MTGKKRQGLGAAGKILLILAAALCYFAAVKTYFSMEKNEVATVYLSASYPGRDAVQAILENCQEDGEITDVCFYWDGGVQTVENPGYVRQAQVQVTGLTGDASLYDWRGASLGDEDREGCVIDRETALELFGTENCVGNTLTLGEESYTVRRVTDWGQHVLLIHPTDRECVYSRVFIRPQKGETKENAASRFLMGYGLSGSLVDDDWLDQTALASLALFPAAALLGFWRFAEEKRKGGAKRTLGYYLWLGAEVLAAAAVLFAVIKCVQIPADWIPDKWSNFRFWGEKLSQERENLGWYLMLPKTVPQAERLMQAVRCMAGGAGSVLLLLAARPWNMPLNRV